MSIERERRLRLEMDELLSRDRTPEEEAIVSSNIVCSEIEAIAKDMRLGVRSHADGALLIVELLKRLPRLPE